MQKGPLDECTSPAPARSPTTYLSYLFQSCSPTTPSLSRTTTGSSSGVMVAFPHGLAEDSDANAASMSSTTEPLPHRSLDGAYISTPVTPVRLDRDFPQSSAWGRRFASTTDVSALGRQRMDASRGMATTQVERPSLRLHNKLGTAHARTEVPGGGATLKEGGGGAVQGVAPATAHCMPSRASYRSCLESNPDQESNCQYALDSYMRCREDTGM